MMKRRSNGCECSVVDGRVPVESLSTHIFLLYNYKVPDPFQAVPEP